MTTEEKIAVMQAEVDGNKIEFRNKKNGEWTLVRQFLNWDWIDYDYRVAKEPRVIYCNEYSGQKLGNPHYSYQEAVANKKMGSTRVVRFVEDMNHNAEGS